MEQAVFLTYIPCWVILFNIIAVVILYWLSYKHSHNTIARITFTLLFAIAFRLLLFFIEYDVQFYKAEQIESLIAGIFCNIVSLLLDICVIAYLAEDVKNCLNLLGNKLFHHSPK